MVLRETTPNMADIATERFIKAIRTALIGPPELSQRDLSKELGITIGSLSKYLRGEVHPGKVGFDVQCNLARALGHSVDTLQHYYQSGQWESELSLEAVTGWLQSSAGAKDLPAIMQSLVLTSARARGATPEEEIILHARYTWPIEALKEAEIPDKLRERMGLTDKVLEALAKDYQYDDDVVTAFSVACNYEEEAVREAFAKQQPIA